MLLLNDKKNANRCSSDSNVGGDRMRASRSEKRRLSARRYPDEAGQPKPFGRQIPKEN